MYKTISFYRYVTVDDPLKLHGDLSSFCQSHQILGRIMLGEEGINGGVSGAIKDIELLKSYLQDKFAKLTYREQFVDKNSYHRLIIRVRKEICAFGADVNLRNKGEYLSPEQLKEMYQNEDDFVIVDARNDYEFVAGRFRDAVKLPIKNFREFPQEIVKHQDWKDKKVVLYCTGGVRCEKASAYMKENGFNQVYHLKGGIIDYVNKFQDNWEGGLFVFDDRLVEDVNTPLNSCIHCNKQTSMYKDCHNLDCDKLFIACNDCSSNCSGECASAPRQRESKVNQKQIGVVKNYFSKKKVALVEASAGLLENTAVTIAGKTTNFSQLLQGIIKDEDGLYSFKVDGKVRKNDLVLV